MDEAFSVMCNNSLSDWENATFEYLPPHSILSSGKFLVCLKSISLDFNIRNIGPGDYLSAFENGQGTIMVVPEGFCENVHVLLNKLNDLSTYYSLALRFDFDSTISRVKVTGTDPNRTIQLYFFDTLAEKLGFTPEYIPVQGNTVQASGPSNVWSGFEYLHLMCPGTCEMSTFGKSVAPVLRSFSVPVQKLAYTKRITWDFSGKERFVPLVTNQLTSITFQLKTINNKPLPFVPSDLSIVNINLGFQRLGLVFP